MTGNHPRFDQIYERHHRSILAYCLRRTSPEDAYAAANEVFEVAWKRGSDLPDGERIEKEWIFRVNDGTITNFQWMWDEGMLHPQDVAADMVDWIEINHPDVFTATFAAECSSATEYNCWNDR